MPDLLEQCIAEWMHEELECSQLRVVLVPSPPEWQPTERMIRIVDEANPKWYQNLCQQYQTGRRKKKKGDTLIKRNHTLRALREIASGRLNSEYAHRVYPHVRSYTSKFVGKCLHEW